MDQSDALRRVGQAVFERRIDMGFESQRELAEAAGVALSTAAQLERGKSFPQPLKRALIEDALQWPRGALDAIRRNQPLPRSEQAERAAPIAPPPPQASAPTARTQSLVIAKGLTKVAATCIAVLLRHPEDADSRAALRELDTQLFNLETLISASLPHDIDLFDEAMSAITALHEQRTAIRDAAQFSSAR